MKATYMIMLWNCIIKLSHYHGNKNKMENFKVCYKSAFTQLKAMQLSTKGSPKKSHSSLFIMGHVKVLD